MLTVFLIYLEVSKVLEYLVVCIFFYTDKFTVCFQVVFCLCIIIGKVDLPLTYSPR